MFLSRVKAVAFWLLNSCLVCGISVSAHALVVLQYHHVSEDTPAATSISPKVFGAHLDYLAENNFNVISIESLPKLLKAGGNLPDRAVIITFDDGYESIYTTAYPLLKKRKWPFTVFVNTKPHDEKNPQYIQWKELREMAKHKATIANHSDSHPHLIRRELGLPVKEWREWRIAQIEFAQKRIEKEIGKAVPFFAYPFGEYDAELERELAKRGYFAFGQQSGPVAKNSNPQSLPRFPFGGVYGDMDDFITKVWSIPLPVTAVKVFTEKGKLITDPELPMGVDIPEVQLVSPIAAHIRGIQCFASGQGAIDTEVKSSTIHVKAKRPLPVGRSRYNCTAPAGGGRFYWYSSLFIKRLPDGTWYSEH